MPKWTVLEVALLAFLPFISACNTDRLAQDGDCSARIRYEGVVYRSHNELNPQAAPGRPLGTADVIDCGGDAARKVDEVDVSAVGGVAPSQAIIVTADQWRGIYVAEDVPRSEWPTRLELE